MNHKLVKSTRDQPLPCPPYRPQHHSELGMGLVVRNLLK